MAEIWKKNNWYTFLLPYVLAVTRASYSNITVEGTIPDDGRAVIVTPNHSNTLMDALVMLRCRVMVFGARADIFSNPTAAKALAFLKIVPLARFRDGLESVARNLEVIPEVIDALAHGMPFCLFPEGRHRPMHSLLPIQKGFARIAIECAAQRPTCIVPAGIDYEDFFHYRKACRIRFGEPVDVNRFLEENAELPLPKQYVALRDLLEERMKAQITYIPDDEDYERRLAELMPPKPKRWWQLPLALLTLPVFIVAAVLSLPLWSLAEFLCHRKIKDPAFRNTARCMVYLFGMPLLFIILAVVLFICLPPLWAACILLCFIPSYFIFYDWTNLVRTIFE